MKKALIFILLYSSFCFSEVSNKQKSLVYPFLNKALETIVKNKQETDELQKQLIEIIDQKAISYKTLKNFYDNYSNQNQNFEELPSYDYTDIAALLSTSKSRFKIKNNSSNGPSTKVTLHAYKFDVIESLSYLSGDDVYFYFIITDGTIPSAKVTDIYKGIKSRSSIFLNEKDRVIFPIDDSFARKLNNHLIVDYGIIKHEGENIEEIKKLSSVVIDIAIAVYAASNPEGGVLVGNLRKEIKSLTHAIASLSKDRQYVTDSLYIHSKDLDSYFEDHNVIDFSKEYSGTKKFGEWKYQLNFRLIKE